MLLVPLTKSQVATSQLGRRHKKIVPDLSITLVQFDYDNKAGWKLPATYNYPTKMCCRWSKPTARHTEGNCDRVNRRDLELDHAESGIGDLDGLLEQLGTQDWQQGAMARSGATNAPDLIGRPTKIRRRARNTVSRRRPDPNWV